MTSGPTAFVGAEIFDGVSMHAGCALLVERERVSAIVAEGEIPEGVPRHKLDGGTLAPGFVDLQVNGGGGVMFNDAQSVETLRCMAEAHARLGTATILPTLITDTAERTRAAIEAAVEAIAEGVPGIAGLHLEGPHLSLARKGAHDPSLIRPMEDADLALLCDAAGRLPALMTTVAPESVRNDQISALAAAGAIVSLGHTDSSYETCRASVRAGARCVTHLYNAQSQMGHREPGVVGAALTEGALSAGLIADFVHVHPAAIRVALAAKQGPGRIFLVTDAMAPAGTDLDGFILNGRRIERQDGRLTLADGTLAGADLDLATAIRNLTGTLGLTRAEALAMATSVPAAVAGLSARHGHLAAGRVADMVHLDRACHLAGVWMGGAAI
ncbi:N-acetylglucosamine-6-phosphate deacetylase [Tropicimonas sediminicola]|uniref:N-acetylglucosamine 6-phosphate deacetylase n=1 Tax=Tropicimonas sediminicola TaxID=1031541 RepID=A0A239I9X8_9RHOB|nr:N-acetylglucosamine-6-phosphate deacetylase [Tropicimonas sediminicola]SNS90357.1 N-acetylglucosamine 6-phosphate deacetylase [Tropicimonas sediminicola]